MKEIKIFHPHIPASVCTVEDWLTEMSRKGLELVKVNGWKFYFHESGAQDRYYIIYSGFDSSRGIANDFLYAKKRYGKTKSLLNKGEYGVFEVEKGKIDTDFPLFQRVRDRYYKKHYISLMIFSVVLMIVTLIASTFNRPMLLLTIPNVCFLMYSIVSLFLLGFPSSHKKE